MTLYSATITLILVMDPLGNVPIFLSVLNTVEPKRRARITFRETFIAFLILTAFLFGGEHILNSLNISEPALGIAGGIILFLIALKMIFPNHDQGNTRERQEGEPFIVPLAIPLIAGPSALATVLLFASQDPAQIGQYFMALAIAASICALVLSFAGQLRKILGQKGLIAIERLMGMILTTVAVQMFLSGIQTYFKLTH